MASYLRIVLACTALLLAFAPAHAKKPYLGLYNVSPWGNHWSPADACEAAIEAHSTDCPGAYITQGCPAWSDFTIHPDTNSTNAFGLTLRKRNHAGGHCAGTQNISFYLRGFCAGYVGGGFLLYVGNGECRCPERKV